MNAPFVVHDFRRPDHDREPERMRAEILSALAATPKHLPSKLFYDDTGSELFEKITELPEYYLTRTELGILNEHMPEIASAIGPNAVVVEFGSGAGTKTRILLEGLVLPVAYIPIEINREQLLDAAVSLVERFPALEVWPVAADYTEHYELPSIDRHYASMLIFFPGSTIGNFNVPDAIRFLRQAREHVGSRGKLLIGADLKKDRRVIEAAYNDSAGVTAAFNRNILAHIGELFGNPIDTAQFGHLAFYNADEGRIEMHLISNHAQQLALGSATIPLEAGEHIVTEYSYKYDRDQFDRMLTEAGWAPEKTWTDAEQLFALTYATAAP
jgi:dimethylhistidine N-methyltransferase